MELIGWRKTLSKFFIIPHRVIVAIMGLLAITIAYTLRIALSLAITEMVQRPNSGNRTESDDSTMYCPVEASSNTDGVEYHDSDKFAWNQELQGIILSSFYWGYVITHIPGGVISVKYGGKVTLSSGMFFAAVFTFLTPVLVEWGGSTALIVARVMVGFGEGVIYPSCCALIAAWTPLRERSILATLVFSGGQIGSIIGSTVSGKLLSSMHWGFVFYFFGGISIMWLLIFLFLIYDSPESHPFVSVKEKEYLNKEMGKPETRNLPPPPFKAILTSPPMLALIVAQIGHNWGFFIMVTDLPKYMSDVLRFSITENGIYSALPYVAMWIVAILTGFLSDFLMNRNYLSITNSRKLFTAIGAIGPGIFMVAASYAECDRLLVVALFTIGMGFMGTYFSGIKSNNIDLSPNYAGVLMACTNGFGGVTGIIGPYIVGVIATNSALEEWRLVFWIAFIIFVLTTIVYIIWASGEVQPWNYPPSKMDGITDNEEVNKNENNSHYDNVKIENDINKIR